MGLGIFSRFKSPTESSPANQLGGEGMEETRSSLMETINGMLAEKSVQVIDNHAQPLEGIRNNPELRQAFQSPIAQELTFEPRLSANVASTPDTSSSIPGGAHSEDIPRSTQKALETDLILEHIFSYCSVTSLKQCREVSSRWLELSSKAWRKSAVLRITRYDHEPFLKLSQFKSILYGAEVDNHQLLEQPFSSYRFKDELDSFQYSLYQACFEKIKGHATFLELTAPREYSQMVSLVFSQFTRLTRLVFVDSYVMGLFPLAALDGVRAHENLKILELRNFRVYRGFPWGDFFRHLPHLRRLVLFCDNFDDGEGETRCTRRLLGTVLEGMAIARGGAEGILDLTDLDLLEYRGFPTPGFPIDMLGLLHRCEFSLRRFSVDFGAETDMKWIRDLLVPFSNTLKYLRVTRRPEDFWPGDDSDSEEEILMKMEKCEEVAGIRIPMEKLEELRFLNGAHWAFELLAHMELPMLEKVVFESDVKMLAKGTQANLRQQDKEFHDAGVVHSFLGQKVFPEVATFEYEHQWNLLASKDIHALAAAMPNLKHLAMPLSSVTFKDVCKLWPDLKSLEVKKCEGDISEFDDESITGFIGPRVVTALQPNITDLEALTDLIISCERRLKSKTVKRPFHESLVTDHSVIHGFLKLPRLHYLSIAFSQISEDVRTALVGHVHFVHFQ